MGLPVAEDRAPRILGVFAHPDDEVFCLGGTMARYTAAGGAGKIVSLTRGESGQIRDVSVGARSTLGAVRADELTKAAAVLGVTETRCFEYGDGTLAQLPLQPLVELTAGIIDEYEPDVVISFGPDGGTGHPDHRRISEVATTAAAASATRPVMLHAVFPRRTNLLVSLIVDWLTALDSRFRGSEEFAHGLMLFADGSSMLGYAADHLSVRFFPAGTFVIEQGESSGDLYLVLSGLVDIIQEAVDGTLTTVATMGPGSFVGEDGIATGQPRNAHVVANSSVTCFVLSPRQASPTAARGPTAGGAEPAAPAQPAAEDPLAVADDPRYIEVDVRDFADRKIEALACHRSQYAIDADMFPRSLVDGIFGVEYFARVDDAGG